MWWFAPFFSSGGYATEARDFVLGLLEIQAVPTRQLAGLRITQHGDAVDEKALEGLSDATLAGLEELRRGSVSPDEAIVICHAEPGAWRPPRYPTSLCPPEEDPAYTVGRTTFETDRIPVEWAARCRAMDEIWVPTEFNRETFIQGGVPPKRIRVVPEAVDTAFFDPAKVDTPLRLPLGESLYTPGEKIIDGRSVGSTLTETETKKQKRRKMLPAGWQACAQQGSSGFAVVFLSVFKWEQRKGWPILLRAFLQAFVNRCDVLLQLITNPFHLDADLTQAARGELNAVLRELNATALPSPDGIRWAPPIAVLDGHLPSKDMPRLYAAANAFVLPSHGEGWGRPHVEAMAMGLPIIATNWSGVTAYLSPNVGYPLSIDGLVPIPEGPYRHRHRWAQPSLSHLTELLIHVAANPDEAKQKGRAARELMVANYSRAVIARFVMAELNRIQRHLEAEGVV